MAQGTSRREGCRGEPRRQRHRRSERVSGGVRVGTSVVETHYPEQSVSRAAARLGQRSQSDTQVFAMRDRRAPSIAFARDGLSVRGLYCESTSGEIAMKKPVILVCLVVIASLP